MKLSALMVAWLLGNLVLAQEVEFDFDEDASFSGLRTFAWVQSEKPPVVLPSTARWQPAQVDAKIRAAVEAALEKKGYRKKPFAEADFHLSYFGTARPVMDTEEYDAGNMALPRMPYGHWRPGFTPLSQASVRRGGTLTIDVVNPETKQILWRAIASGTIKEPKELDKKIHQVVEKIFDEFPPE